jgi:hypothetical protein
MLSLLSRYQKEVVVSLPSARESFIISKMITSSSSQKKIVEAVIKLEESLWLKMNRK